MRTLLHHFARGVLIALPIAVTLYLVVSIVSFVDGLLRLDVPGLGLAVTLVLLTLLGWVTSSVLGTRLVSAAERLLERLPLVRILYSSIRDLVGAFVGDRKGFHRPVAVALPGGTGWVFGFATREDVPVHRELDDHVAVYFPQSYNVAGNLVAVPRRNVVFLSVPSSEFMSFLVSGGIAGLDAHSATTR